MQTKYKILNPLTGQYDTFDTFDACADELGIRAWEFYLLHTHHNPYTVVEVNDDGSETWRNPTGEELHDPNAVLDDVIEEIKAYKENPQDRTLGIDSMALTSANVLAELPAEILSNLNLGNIDFSGNTEITHDMIIEALMTSNLEVMTSESITGETPS